jgi:hypothetical protein
MKRFGIFLITAALIAGIVGCVGGDGNGGGGSYTLIVDFTDGGTVTVDDVPIPGKAILTYGAGTVVGLNATPSAGYRFAEWAGNVSTIADVNAASVSITMNGNYEIIANFVTETPTPAPSVLTVGGSGTYATIREAIDATRSGDTIQVAQGTYLENITIETSKSFTLQGGWDAGFISWSSDSSLTVIDGRGSGSAIQIRADPDIAIELTVEGFTMRNGIAEWGGGIRVASYGGSSITLLLNNNLITENTATNRGAALLTLV